MRLKLLPNVKDVLFYILRAWKKTVVCGLILGLLFSCISVFRSLRSWDSKNASIDEYTRSYEQSMTMYDEAIGRVDNLTQLENDNIFNLRNDIQNSILPSIGSGIAGSADIDLYFINSEFPLGCLVYTVLIDRYEAYINNQIDWESVTENTGFDDPFLKDYLLVEKDMDASVIRVKVIFTDSESAELILNEIICQIDLAYEQMLNDFGVFSIIKSEIHRNDGFIPEATEVADMIVGRYVGIDERKDSLKAELKELKSNLPAAPIERPSVMLTVKSAVKYFLFGFVLMFFMFIFIRFLKFVFIRRIYSYSQFSDMTKKRVNVVSVKKYSWFDRLLWNLENYVQPDTIRNAVYGYIYGSNLEGKRILIVGDVDKSFGEVVFDDCTVEIVENVATDFSVLKNTGKYDAAIIVAKRDMSNEAKIKNDIASLNVPVIGCILIV